MEAPDAKIDSIYAFTGKGLRELESFMEPWIKGLIKGVAQGTTGTVDPSSLHIERGSTSVPDITGIWVTFGVSFSAPPIVVASTTLWDFGGNTFPIIDSVEASRFHMSHNHDGSIPMYWIAVQA